MVPMEGLEAIEEATTRSMTGGGESVVSSNSKHHDDLGRNFQKLATASRIVVVLVLTVSATVTALFTYKLLSKDEADDFSGSFTALANEVIQLASNNGEGIFLGVKAFSSMYVPLARLSGQKLPFVTIADFAIYASDAKAVCKASHLLYMPMLRTEQELQEWNAYSASNVDWIDEGRMHQNNGVPIPLESSTLPFAFNFGPKGPTPEDMSNGPVSPMWQLDPVPMDTPLRIANYNVARNPTFAPVRDMTVQTGRAALSTQDFFIGLNEEEGASPLSMLVQPIFSGFDYETNTSVVAHTVAMIPWSEYFSNVLQDGQEVFAVVESCGSNSTFHIVGHKAHFVGSGDLYEGSRDLAVTGQFVNATEEEEQMEGCRHVVYVFPADFMRENFTTSKPTLYPIVIVAIFGFCGIVFIVYDIFVTNRQHHTEHKAATSNAIVQDMFPGDVAKKLYADTTPAAPKNRRSSIGSDTSARECSSTIGTKAIADFYPATTVLFADIAGFTAWSSSREPQQVFYLLESIFKGFDTCAKQLGVFKVETIGDCYVAVCGLPKANRHHAVVIARFARAMMEKFTEIVLDLERSLGPGTQELRLRVGFHSGPVTAGVLRGDRARFQLFGDTINTSSRMESCGQRGRIHLSQESAKELVKHGKIDWLTKREDMIEAKGKGKMVTYWLSHTSSPGINSICDIDENQSPGKILDVLSELPMANDVRMIENEVDLSPQLKLERLVEWNTELLMGHLKKVVARRTALRYDEEQAEDLDHLARLLGEQVMTVNSVQEVIDIPEQMFDQDYADGDTDLGSDVASQLREYVAEIASMYSRENAFHNFEHASHVAMSVNKLLFRIVNPQRSDKQFTTKMDEVDHVHQCTLGLSSDPLTVFSCVFAALFHDVQHRGLSNFDLAKEDPDLNEQFQGKSIAEQNSIHVAWSLLLMPQYSLLRRCIFATEAELNRFWSLLVNSVIATDIFDKDLAFLRRSRWNKAFFDEERCEGTEVRNRKATIVLEHVIQASDVVHTMQHWHVYRKWNSRLFHEMMDAYRKGRTTRDPSLGWYEGELLFFEKYIIPLAQKLKDCSVFGVSSDEYLNYAVLNRDEWREKGKAIVQQMTLDHAKTAEHRRAEADVVESVRFTI